jgi:hypothetical protein
MGCEVSGIIGDRFGFEKRDGQVLAALSYVYDTLITYQENISTSCSGALMRGLTLPSSSAMNHEAVAHPSSQV